MSTPGREATDRELYRLYEEFSRLTAERDALQERLTVADQNADTWETRACSEATKLHQAEKRVEVLESQREAACLRAQELAERNEHIRELIGEAGYDWLSTAAVEKMKTFLSASAEPGCPFDPTKHFRAEPGAMLTVYGGVKAPVERDERARYEAACHARAKANGRFYESYYFRRTNADDRYLNPMAESGWQAWQARAALDSKATEGASHQCKACHGEGVIHTGIDESPTTICNRCEGLGHE